MRITVSRCVLVSVAWMASDIVAADERAAVDWPQFRGWQACGVADGFPLPSHWDAESGQNILWRTPLPGLGHSCPIIWGDRVYVTTAVGEAAQDLRVGLYGDIMPVNEDKPYEWRLLCLEKSSGKILWNELIHKGVPKVKRHPKASHANSTPATDGRRIVVCLGPEGLHCYDTSGKRVWSKDLGDLDSGYFAVPAAQWGFGSSPVIFNERVYLQCDVQKNSFLAAYDLNDGGEVWRTPRQEVPTWGSPTVYVADQTGDSKAAGAVQIVVNGWKHIGGYDAASGKEVWRMMGTADIPVPTPVVWNDLFYFTASHGPSPFTAAVKAKDAKGELVLPTGEKRHEAVAWAVFSGAYMQTPIVYGDVLYVCRDNGVLTAHDARTGEQLFRERLGDGRTGFTASAVAGDGKLFYTSESGEVYVLKAGRAFEPIAGNELKQTCMATPGISAGVLYFRTDRELIAVGEKK